MKNLFMPKMSCNPIHLNVYLDGTLFTVDVAYRLSQSCFASIPLPFGVQKHNDLLLLSNELMDVEGEDYEAVLRAATKIIVDLIPPTHLYTKYEVAFLLNNLLFTDVEQRCSDHDVLHQLDWNIGSVDSPARPLRFANA